MYQIWVEYWNENNDGIFRAVTKGYPAPVGALAEFEEKHGGYLVGATLVEVDTPLVQGVDRWYQAADLEYKECVYRLLGHPDSPANQEWVGIPPQYAAGCGTRAEILRFE